MSEIERGPKPGSYRLIVYEAYRGRKPYASMLAESDITDGQAFRAISGLLEGKYFPEGFKDTLYRWRYGVFPGQRVLNPQIDFHRLQISEHKGGETAQMFPLLIRGFGLDEIWGITRFSIDQMHNVLSYLRRERGVLVRPTGEESGRTRLQTKRIRRILAGEESLTADEEKSFALAGEFLRSKLIPVELDSWNGLQQAYSLHDRRLPRLFADRLRLETFFTARMQAARGDMKLLAAYKYNGDKVDSKWFDKYLGQEEEFITEVLEGEMYFHVDEKGLFQIDDKGNRWRPIDIVDGEVVVAGFEQLRERRMARQWQPRK